MQNEKGYVLIFTIVLICLLTISAAILARRTLYASMLVLRRADSIRAYQLAESGALEGFWRLSREPGFRTGSLGLSKNLNDATNGFSGSYTYQIIDLTPANLADDLQLEILGTGISGRCKRVVHLRLTRTTLTSKFEKVLWQEESILNELN